MERITPMKKNRKITARDQRTAASILCDFRCTENMDDVIRVYNELVERYGLCFDPFTSMPCTPEEYCENQLEYEKQVMMERYGHCDGLE